MFLLQFKAPMRVLVALAIALALAGCANAPTGPDIVVIVLDTVRPDRFGFYGAESEPAPFLASVAEHSMVFTEAISTSSWTAPATASLHTGLYPPQHGVLEGMMAHRTRVREIQQAGQVTVAINSLDPESPTLAERLEKLGYGTWALTTNINIGDEIGFFRGFERSQRLDTIRLDVHGGPAAGKRGRMCSAPADRVVDRLRAWVEKEGKPESSFVYLHFNDAHRPYNLRDPWYQRDPDPIEDALAAYDSEIHFMDSNLRQVWELLGIDDDDLVIIVSDHGEGFHDHGIVSHEFGLYRATNRILMMVHGPGLGLKSGVSEVPVSLIDIVPTILDLEKQDVTGLPGRSLLPLLTTQPVAGIVELDDRTLFAHRLEQGKPPREAWVAQADGWKLILEGESVELFHVSEDPSELKNLAALEPEIASKLVNECLDFQQWARPASSASSMRMDEERLEALRSLGYID